MLEPPYEMPPYEEGEAGSASGPEREVFRDASLVVIRQDHVDYGAREADGYVEYHYRFAYYVVPTQHGVYGARRYVDEWSRVSVMPQKRKWPTVPYDDPGFAEVVRYFAKREQIAVSVFAGGAYVDVDVKRLAPHGASNPNE